MRVCVVTPMFNEGKMAKRSIETILPYIKECPPGVDLLVVNDGSTDQTEKILCDLAGQDHDGRFLFISNQVNMGYGGALREGGRFAIENNYDYVLFMDSDLTNHPRYIEKFYGKMEEGWDYIKATRYSDGGGMDGVPWNRRINSILGNRVARLLCRLPITDATNGFRAVKVSILKQISTIENGFAIIMEELYRAALLTDSFCEIPYILTARSEDEGRTHFSYGFDMYCRYLHYALKCFFVKKPAIYYGGSNAITKG